MLEAILNSYSGYFNYLMKEVTNPHLNNYFYWLLVVSLFFFVLEVLLPWRRNQKIFRKDFWLDFFYMFFNFFLFSLIIYNALSNVVVKLFNDLIHSVSSIDLTMLNPMYSWPHWAILLTGFIVRDFVQWNTHRLLHRVPFLWEFHKVHHSVQEMGFAAHLRYHWMETLVYRTIEYIPLAILGIPLHDFFIIHIFTLAVGHYNHSNITISSKVTSGVLGGLVGLLFITGSIDLPELGLNLGAKLLWFCIFVAGSILLVSKFIKILFNSPEMHIWHHSKNLPDDRRYGVNFGLTLALWDYLFKTNYIPYEGRDIDLGFDKVEHFPKSFKDQVFHGFKK